MIRTKGRGRRLGGLLIVAGLFALVGALTVPAVAEQPTDPGNSANAPGQSKPGNDNKPAGNNGVLKVDGIPAAAPGGGDEGAPGRSHRDNEPHVGCVFNLDWYGFEAGDGTSNVTFELWGQNKGFELVPSDGSSVQVGGDAQGNADDQDATQQYDLSSAIQQAKDAGYEPNDQQGFLVKVTIETDGLSQGADVKHKVFWIDDDCGRGSTTTTVNEERHDTSLVLGEVITATTTTTTEPPTTEAPTTEPPTTEAPAPTVGPQVLGVQLARTGAGTQVLLLVAGLLLLAGGAALVAGRKESVTRS